MSSPTFGSTPSEKNEFSMARTVARQRTALGPAPIIALQRVDRSVTPACVLPEKTTNRRKAIRKSTRRRRLVYREIARIAGRQMEPILPR